MPNLPTLPPNPSASPERGIDRLFAELLSMYGRHWVDLWVDTDVESVKQSWSSALHGLDRECIRLALESMRTDGKPFPPTQPEFVARCRQFVRRGSHVLALATPKTQAPADAFKSLRKILAEAGTPR